MEIIILLLIAVLLLDGGHAYRNGYTYAHGGIGLVLIIVLVALVVRPFL